MKRMFAVSCLLAGLIATDAPAAPAAQPAAADVSLVQQRVARVEVLRGNFAQEKRIAGFKNPLRSQGTFVVSRVQGVIWTTLKPFPSEMVVTRDRILSRQKDGSTRVEVDARQQPALRSVNTMMFALVSGDAAALSSAFKTEVQARPDNGWVLNLTPKSAALAQSFARIVVTGDRYVRRVEIEEASGDRTQLSFTDITDAPARLSPDEARRFD